MHWPENTLPVCKTYELSSPILREVGIPRGRIVGLNRIVSIMPAFQMLGWEGLKFKANLASSQDLVS